jgi:hypothetical protein
VEYRTLKRPRRHVGVYPVRIVVGSREIHHARIYGSQDIMTVFVLRGGNFAEVCLCSSASSRVHIDWQERAKAIELQSYRCLLAFINLPRRCFTESVSTEIPIFPSFLES